MYMKKDVALTLSCGGARGLAHIGVIRALEARGYSIRAVAGCSIGSVVGAFYAMGRLDALEGFMRTVSTDNMTDYLDFALTEHGFIRGGRFIEKLKELAPDCLIESLPVRLSIVAANLTTGRAEVFTRGSVYEAVRASIAIPAVLTPVEKEGARLVDGSVVNPLPVDATEAVELPANWAESGALDEAGTPLPCQREGDRSLVRCTVPAHGSRTLRRGGASVPVEKSAELVLENDLVRYEFDSDARLLRAFDKSANREVICGAAGNLLGLYVDEPNNWDAWDVDFTYQDVPPVYATGIRAEKTAAGAVRQVLEFELAVGKSKIRQQVVLAANSKRLDFNTEVDWNEHHRMLRVTFPTAIQTAEARCDIQYGYITRPTHRNTLWDFARFEVAAQRYVDISDVNGGAALLNDCKYGYKLLDGVLDLNLLRSPGNPDPVADLGHHVFTYSFLPHEGGLVGSEVMQEAACLNRAPLVLPGRSEALELPCRLVDGAGASLEVLKLAYKRNERIIRVVETDGCNSTARLVLADGSKLVETNLVEWGSGMTLKPEDGVVEIPLKPFEIRTFRIR